jgi:polysaccharide deacetylase family protein (PEP-CTERM system associated)
MLNALTVDVEDYFHVEAFASRISPQHWDQYSPRVERNVEEVLALFDRCGVKATFFVLGWVAQKFSHLVRRIVETGHEMGCHGQGHQHLHRLTPKQFRADVREARQRLMAEVQRPVSCYRAPSFSITRSTVWALDILSEEGFVADSSIFPIRHDFYGIPDARRFPCWYKTSGGNTIFEFPPSTVRRCNNNWGVGGGGYLRLLPYHWTRWALRQINEKERQPAMVYFHPWEIDPEQPRISACWRSRFRHYTNLATMKKKLERLTLDFKFTTFSAACCQLDSFRSRESIPWMSNTNDSLLSRKDLRGGPVPSGMVEVVPE